MEVLVLVIVIGFVCIQSYKSIFISILMTRKDLQEKYNIIGDNKEISLYRKRSKSAYGGEWCGSIALKKGKAVFQSKTYTTIEELDKALVEWAKSLPYPVDTYDPMIRDAYRVEARIVWHLTKNLGFVADPHGWNVFYNKKIGLDCALSFSIKMTNNMDGVEIYSKCGKYRFHQVVDNAETGVAIINSIVNGSTLAMAKDILDLMSVCDADVTTEIDAYVPANNIFGVQQVSFKDFMIDRLEKVLVNLKG